MYEEPRLQRLFTLCLSLLGLFSLPIFDSGFGGCCSVHIGSFNRVSELAPEPVNDQLLFGLEKGWNSSEEGRARGLERVAYRLDSFSSCSDSGRTLFGTILAFDGVKQYPLFPRLLV